MKEKEWDTYMAELDTHDADGSVMSNMHRSYRNLEREINTITDLQNKLRTATKYDITA
jgi:hypothetical protein